MCLCALLEKGAAVDAAMNDGFTSLMISVQNGHDHCALALLEAGADKQKEVPGFAGWNALKLAERNGHIVICNLLKV